MDVVWMLYWFENGVERIVVNSPPLSRYSRIGERWRVLHAIARSGKGREARVGGVG